MPRNNERCGNLFSRPFPLPAHYALMDGRMDAKDSAKMRELSERVTRLKGVLRAAKIQPSSLPDARARFIEDTEYMLGEAEVELEVLKMDACA